MANDVVVMHNGRIDQRGTIRDLRDNPATDYVRLLMQSALEQVEPLMRAADLT
jgi:ABC-type microcin C transport system duplicated ATPase subunit YejF